MRHLHLSYGTNKPLLILNSHVIKHDETWCHDAVILFYTATWAYVIYLKYFIMMAKQNEIAKQNKMIRQSLFKKFKKHDEHKDDDIKILRDIIFYHLIYCATNIYLKHLLFKIFKIFIY
jgi:uncharacterized membrane protein SpoIIM required for sporulation